MNLKVQEKKPLEHPSAHLFRTRHEGVTSGFKKWKIKMTVCLCRSHVCLNNLIIVISSLSQDHVDSMYQVIEYVIHLGGAKVFLLEQLLPNIIINAYF